MLFSGPSPDDVAWWSSPGEAIPPPTIFPPGNPKTAGYLKGSEKNNHWGFPEIQGQLWKTLGFLRRRGTLREGSILWTSHEKWTDEFGEVGRGVPGVMKLIRKWVEHQVLGNNGSVHYFDPEKPLVNATIWQWLTWWSNLGIPRYSEGSLGAQRDPKTMRQQAMRQLTKDGERFASFSTRKARFPPSKRCLRTMIMKSMYERFSNLSFAEGLS